MVLTHCIAKPTIGSLHFKVRDISRMFHAANVSQIVYRLLERIRFLSSQLASTETNTQETSASPFSFYTKYTVAYHLLFDTTLVHVYLLFLTFSLTLCVFFIQLRRDCSITERWV